MMMTDGRAAYIRQAVTSLDEMVSGIDGQRIIHDDSGDRGYRIWLRREFPQWTVIGEDHRRGFTMAYHNSWWHARQWVDGDFVFQTEDDFLYNRPVDLAELADVLDSQPHLAQLALRRQPWNEAERQAGGIVEREPDAYTDCADEDGREWLEHRQFYTTNPSLFRHQLTAHEWPTVARSEGMITFELREQGLPWGVTGPDMRFAFWGGRSSGEWVTHIGHERAGIGY